jgi:2'-5' RNA ligase
MNIYRCQFVFELPTSVVTDVRYFKNLSKELIGDFPSFTSKAHLTLMKEQSLTIEMLDYFLWKLEQPIGQIESADIDLDGFGVFDSADVCTFFLKIKPFHLTHKFFDHLDDLLPHSISKHHVTIARGITKMQLTTLTEHFRNVDYKNSFTPIGITVLLKNESTPGTTFKPYKTLFFKEQTLTAIV